MLLNGYQLTASALIFIAGCMLSFFVFIGWRNDLLFYFTAKKEIVLVESVKSNMEMLYSPVTQAAPSYVARSDLVLETSYGRRIASEEFYGTKESVEMHVIELKSREKQKVELFISAKVPSHHAFELGFPFRRMMFFLVWLILLVIPAGGVIIYYFYERKRKK
jgi:hypothetical protein